MTFERLTQHFIDNPSYIKHYTFNHDKMEIADYIEFLIEKLASREIGAKINYAESGDDNTVRIIFDGH